MWINRSDEAWQSAASLQPFFACLSSPALPRPTQLQVGNLKPREIQGYDSGPLVKALDRDDINVTLSSADGAFKTLIWPLKNRTAISIYLPPISPDDAHSLFVRIAETVNPTYARCHFYSAMNDLEAAHYKRYRTFYASGLYWLNFFGPEEEAGQGGPSLAHNPFAEVRRLPSGLFLQVCSSPTEAASPEGVRRLVQATSAMPPLPGQAQEPPAQTTPLAEQVPLLTEELTLAGQHGFYDKATESFWITKNLVPATSLSAKAIAQLSAIRQSANPKITRVNVLFSLKEAAEINKSALDATGAGTWFVSADTGMPEKI
jgi:hypothetical protein